MIVNISEVNLCFWQRLCDKSHLVWLLMNTYNTLFCSSSLALSAADIPEVASRNFFSAESLSIDRKGGELSV